MGVRVTAIVPVLNERQRLPWLVRALSSSPGIDEVVVVDGGSTDGSVAWLGRCSDVVLVRAARGRGVQLAAGAAIARGSALVMVHADVRPPPDLGAHVLAALARPGVVAGAFAIRTRCESPEASMWLRAGARVADVRSLITSAPYGDQCVFVSRSAYEAAGGIPRQVLFEDIELTRRLRRVGRVVRAPGRVEVSARRLEQHPLLSALAWNVLPGLYRCGVPASLLACAYGNPR